MSPVDRSGIQKNDIFGCDNRSQAFIRSNIRVVGDVERPADAITADQHVLTFDRSLCQGRVSSRERHVVCVMHTERKAAIRAKTGVRQDAVAEESEKTGQLIRLDRLGVESNDPNDE